MVIGMPQLIILVIMSQHISSMPMLIMPVGIIMQRMPWLVISHFMVGIMAMPQQLIMCTGTAGKRTTWCFGTTASVMHVTAGCPDHMRRRMHRTTIAGDVPY